MRREVPDFDARADAEERKEAVSGEAAKKQGAPEGNQNASKENKQGNSLVVSDDRPKRKDGGSKSPERIIARLKRDKDDPEHPEREKAAFLLAGIEHPEPIPTRASKPGNLVMAAPARGRGAAWETYRWREALARAGEGLPTFEGLFDSGLNSGPRARRAAGLRQPWRKSP